MTQISSYEDDGDVGDVDDVMMMALKLSLLEVGKGCYILDVQNKLVSIATRTQVSALISRMYLKQFFFT